MRRIEMYLKMIYERMKKKYLGEKSNIIPPRYWSQFVCLGGASEVQYLIGQSVSDKKRVLIIGIYGGRDYFYLKAKGKEVFALDLFNDTNFENLTIGNVENDLPYPENFFDAVIIGEVIEHCVRDYDALLNIRKVLKDDGFLILTIPFLNDYEPTHIRLYNRKTAVRLLNAAGFTVDKIFERPNLFFWPPMINLLHHSLNALLFLLFKITIYKYTLPVFWKIEEFLATKNFPLRKYFKSYGAIFKCYKNNKFFNYVAHNRLRFGGE